MAPRKRLILVGFLSFVAGLISALGVGYMLLRPAMDFFGTSPFISAASHGKLYVTVLNQIHRGETDRATQTLEALLDGEITTLAFYEETIRADARDQTIYDAAGVMREYREQHPRSHADAEVSAVIERGLNLRNGPKPP